MDTTALPRKRLFIMRILHLHMVDLAADPRQALLDWRQLVLALVALLPLRSRQDSTIHVARRLQVLVTSVISNSSKAISSLWDSTALTRHSNSPLRAVRHIQNGSNTTLSGELNKDTTPMMQTSLTKKAVPGITRITTRFTRAHT